MHYIILISAFLGFLAPDDTKYQPPPAPTIQDLHDMYDHGDYQACLQQAGRALRLAGNSQTFDRDEVNLLRAKSLIALKDGRSAIRMVEPVLKSSNTDQATEARALTTLLRASPGVRYTPKGGGSPIDLSVPANLKPGMLALLEDQLVAFEPEVKRGLGARDLSPMMPLVPRLLELHALEMAATGSNDRLKEIALPLGEHARDLIGDELNRREHDVNSMEKMASAIVDTGGHSGHGWWGGVSRRGLVSDERDKLYDLMDYVAQIERATQQGHDVSVAVNGNTAAWDELTTKAQRLRQRAQEVIDAEGVRTNNDTR